MAASKKVTVILSNPQAKKNVVRYDAAEGDEDAALQNAYPTKAALKKLGDPDEIKITIEAN
jgi:hypothetical protein